MQSESTGTLTAICMLIPLVSVPYFAIRGTQDLEGKLPSLDGADELAFASTEGFGDESMGESDAPPFPGGESIVVETPGAISDSNWSNPFDGENGATSDAGDVAGGAFSEFKEDVSSALDQQRDRAKSGLNGAIVRGGEPTSHGVPAQMTSHSRPAPRSAPRSGIAAEWEAGVAQLKTVGMRNYRVESLKDKSVYYVTAFFPDTNSGVNLRVEGEGPHPITALRSVIQQVNERRAGNSR